MSNALAHQWHCKTFRPWPQNLFSVCFEHALHGTTTSVTLQLPVPNSAVAGSIQQVLEVRWKLWECKVVILSNDSSSVRFLNHLGKTGFPSHKTQMLPDGITDHRLCNGSLNKISAM